MTIMLIMIFLFITTTRANNNSLTSQKFMRVNYLASKMKYLKVGSVAYRDTISYHLSPKRHDYVANRQ